MYESIFLSVFEFSCIIVSYRLLYLFFCVHHEWSIVSNALSEWFPCHEEDFSIRITYEADTFTCFGEVEHITMMIYLLFYHDVPFCDKKGCSISCRKCCSEFTFSIEPYIIELHRRKSLCSSAHALILPCYHTDTSSYEVHFWYTLSSECLISRCYHLVLTRKIDPELDSMLDTTSTGESLCHELIVEEATSCRHPLHLIRTDNSTTSSSILVFHLS